MILTTCQTNRKDMKALDNHKLQSHHKHQQQQQQRIRPSSTYLSNSLDLKKHQNRFRKKNTIPKMKQQNLRIQRLDDRQQTLSDKESGDPTSKVEREESGSRHDLVANFSFFLLPEPV